MSISIVPSQLPQPDNTETLSQNAQGSVVELIFAGRALARYITDSLENKRRCVCGLITGPHEQVESHNPNCPVARYFASVERVWTAVL